MTLPIHTDRNPTLQNNPTAVNDGKSSTQSSQTAPQSMHSATDAGKPPADPKPDIARADQLYNLSNQSTRRSDAGGIETGAQAREGLSRVKALFNQQPAAALQAITSGLDQGLGTLLLTQPD